VSARRPPLSVVIATTKPWPEMRATLDSLLPQARDLGAEVIVADGDGRGLPDPPALPVKTRRAVRRLPPTTRVAKPCVVAPSQNAANKQNTMPKARPQCTS